MSKVDGFSDMPPPLETGFQPRLSCCILVDTSLLQASPPENEIQFINEWLLELKSCLESNPKALDCMELCVVTFGGIAEVSTGFLSVSEFEIPKLEFGGEPQLSDAIHLGLDLIEAQCAANEEKHKIYKPLLIILASGAIANGSHDSEHQWQSETIARLRECAPQKLNVVAISSTDNQEALGILSTLTKLVFTKNQLDAGDLFSELLTWGPPSIFSPPIGFSEEVETGKLLPMPDSATLIQFDFEGDSKPIGNAKPVSKNKHGSPRLPCCILVDISDSNPGHGLDHLAMVKEHLSQFKAQIENSPRAMECVEVTTLVIGGEGEFPSEFRDISELGLNDLKPQRVSLGQGICQAIKLLRHQQREYDAAHVVSFEPWLVVISNSEVVGSPNDWNEAIQEAKQFIERRGTINAFATSATTRNILLQVCQRVFTTEDLDFEYQPIFSSHYYSKSVSNSVVVEPEEPVNKDSGDTPQSYASNSTSWYDWLIGRTENEYRLHDAQSDSNERIRLRNRISSGGEATIFETDRRGSLAKIYRNPSKVDADKIEFLIRHQPQLPSGIKKPWFAWPTSTISQNEEFVGFTMPRLADSVELTNMIFVKARKMKFPRLTPRQIVTTCANIANVVDFLHRNSFVIVDLKPEDILVDKQCLVSLVDVDSLQFSNDNVNYHSRVITPGYRSPESIRGNWNPSTHLFEPSHDLFSLGVLIHELLFLGLHPFLGGENVDADIANGNYIQKPELIPDPQKRKIAASNLASRPPMTSFPQPIQRLFERCFVEGNSSPDLRPTGNEWQQELAELNKALTQCQNNPVHWYYEY